jgi:mersacidin/lichenicidin family type 2 lantibiotic
MKKQDVIRAWRDGEYFANLSNDQASALPASPAAVLEIGDDVLADLNGGISLGGACPTSAICTPCPPRHCY